MMAIAERDLRIDFFRGIALLIVLVDHVEFNAGSRFASYWTLLALGFSDAAEIFVFLSGYSFGLSYSQRMERDGCLACQWKAFVRAAQIYLVSLIALSIVMGVGSKLRLSMSATIEMLMLQPQPNGFGILTFYVVILPFMPLLLAILRQNPAVAWLLSGGCYVTTQVLSGEKITEWLDLTQWFFNPFAWQFLFFIGMTTAGLKQHTDKGWQRMVLASLASGMLLLGLLVVKIVPWIVRAGGRAPTLPYELWQFQFPPTGKSNLHVIRLVHGLALVYLASVLFPRGLSCWRTCLCRPFVACGQHSLVTYAFGLVVAQWCPVISKRVEGGMGVLATDVTVCFLSIGIAQVLSRLSRNCSRNLGREIDGLPGYGT